MEVTRMVEQSITPTADLDGAIAHRYRQRVGSLRLTGIVGLNVGLAIEQYLDQTLNAPQFKSKISKLLNF